MIIFVKQSAVEEKVKFILSKFREEKVSFLRDNHIGYLKNGIRLVGAIINVSVRK